MCSIFFPLIDHAQNFRSQKAQFFAHLQFPLCGESAQWEGHALRVLCHGPIKTTIKHKRGVVGCTLQYYVLRIYIQATSCKKKVSSRSISTLSLLRHDDSLRFCWVRPNSVDTAVMNLKMSFKGILSKLWLAIRRKSMYSDGFLRINFLIYLQAFFWSEAEKMRLYQHCKPNLNLQILPNLRIFKFLQEFQRISLQHLKIK